MCELAGILLVGEVSWQGGRAVSLLEASMMGCCFFSEGSIGG